MKKNTTSSTKTPVTKKRYTPTRRLRNTHAPDRQTAKPAPGFSELYLQEYGPRFDW
jgi:hypothetical protein